MPAAIQRAAAKRAGAVGRKLDSTGRHVAYWYEAPNGNGWRVYRTTVSGMLAVLRSAPRQ